MKKYILSIIVLLGTLTVASAQNWNIEASLSYPFLDRAGYTDASGHINKQAEITSFEDSKTGRNAVILPTLSVSVGRYIENPPLSPPALSYPPPSPPASPSAPPPHRANSRCSPRNCRARRRGIGVEGWWGSCNVNLIVCNIHFTYKSLDSYLIFIYKWVKMPFCFTSS